MKRAWIAASLAPLAALGHGGAGPPAGLMLLFAMPLIRPVLTSIGLVRVLLGFRKGVSSSGWTATMFYACAIAGICALGALTQFFETGLAITGYLLFGWAALVIWGITEVKRRGGARGPPE